MSTSNSGASNRRHLQVAHPHETTNVDDSTPPSPTSKTLDEVTERVCRKLAEADREDALARYEVGVEISEIKEKEDKYGKGWVETIAAAVMMSPKTLYGYGTTAAAWSRAEFEALMARTTQAGMRLSWSHLSVLAEVEDKERRSALVAEVLKRSLSVRELAKLARGGPAESTPTASAVAKPISIVDRTGALRRSGQDFVSQLEAWCDETVPRLETGAAPADDLLERIENAKEDLEEVTDDLRDRLARLDRALKTARAKRVAPSPYPDVAPASPNTAP